MFFYYKFRGNGETDKQQKGSHYCAIVALFNVDLISHSLFSLRVLGQVVWLRINTMQTNYSQVMTSLIPYISITYFSLLSRFENVHVFETSFFESLF